MKTNEHKLPTIYKQVDPVNGALIGRIAEAYDIDNRDRRRKIAIEYVGAAPGPLHPSFTRCGLSGFAVWSMIEGNAASDREGLYRTRVTDKLFAMIALELKYSSGGLPGEFWTPEKVREITDDLIAAGVLVELWDDRDFGDGLSHTLEEAKAAGKDIWITTPEVLISFEHMHALRKKEREEQQAKRDKRKNKTTRKTAQKKAPKTPAKMTGAETNSELVSPHKNLSGTRSLLRQLYGDSSHEY